jgi:hypothetical protein
MSDALDWKRVVEGLTSRVNVLEAELEKVKERADKADAYMAVASKLAARNHEIRELHGHVAYASAESPLDESIPVWQR